MTSEPTNEIPSDEEAAALDGAVLRYNGGCYVAQFQVNGVRMTISREDTLRLIEECEQAVATMDLLMSLERRHRRTEIQANPL